MDKARLITLRATTISRYRNRDGKAACDECGREFEVGDKAVSKTRGSALSGKSSGPYLYQVRGREGDRILANSLVRKWGY